MAMNQDQTSALGATRIAVGLSAIICVRPQQFQTANTIKILSGGGTLEIVQPPVALTGASAAGWGAGYPVSGTLDINLPRGPLCFYLAATGATMVVGLMSGYDGAGMTLVIA